MKTWIIKAAGAAILLGSVLTGCIEAHHYERDRDYRYHQRDRHSDYDHRDHDDHDD